MRNAVLLKIGGMRLVLAQADVRSLESVMDIDPADCPQGSVGWAPYAGQRWPAYCLGEGLLLLEPIPAARRVCALLALPQGYLGVLCDEARTLVDFQEASFEIPACMYVAQSPISGLRMVEEGLACVSDAGRLSAYLQQTSVVHNAEVL
ncbi:MAG: hypothetical protein Q8R67_18400 [Rhodoferax sp.]|nr:hypothetical protein [Rhodoferax sp.]MDP3653646.1 hypothetical protein [Rhodoferax sp.]